MFTGIVKNVSKIQKISYKGNNISLQIEQKSDLKIGESVAVNGVCLSVVENKRNSLVFDVVKNTLKGTNIKRLKIGNFVNIEYALKMEDFLSGHIVSGHIDGERKILKKEKTQEGYILDIDKILEDKNKVIQKGSITIDGISLTISDIFYRYIRIFLIPHTLENTNLKYKKIGDYVNIEFDMLAKYSMLQKEETGITKEFLIKKGFINI